MSLRPDVSGDPSNWGFPSSVVQTFGNAILGGLGSAGMPNPGSAPASTHMVMCLQARAAGASPAAWCRRLARVALPQPWCWGYTRQSSCKH